MNRIVHVSSYVTHSVHHVYTQSDQTNKPTIFRKQLRNYRSISNTSTGYSPANKLQQLPIRKVVKKFKSYQSAVPRTRTKYHINQLVWTLDHQLNHRSKWQAALIKRNLGSMVYEVRFNNGQCYKGHENQLRPRFSSNNQLFETNNLPDDLLNKMLQYNTIRSRQLSSLRQPRQLSSSRQPRQLSSLRQPRQLSSSRQPRQLSSLRQPRRNRKPLDHYTSLY